MIKKQNKAGTWFALVQIKTGNYLVYKYCINSNGKVRGGMSGAWRYVQPVSRMSYAESSKMAREGLPLEEAEALFNKRLAGKQK